jgi:hypothetical protein
MSSTNGGPTIHSDAALLLFGIHRRLEVIKAKVRGVRLRPAKAITEDDETPYAPWAWLLCGLGALADLLELSPEWLPVKQLLEEVLRNWPVSTVGGPRLNAALAHLRKARWAALLYHDCEAVATLLRELICDLKRAAEADRISQKRLWKAHFGETEGDFKMVRTPVPFHFDRHDYHFPYRQSLLLDFLRKGLLAPAGEVMEHVWGTLEGKRLNTLENRLHQLQLATNRTLRRKKLPLKIVRPEPNFLQLKNLRDS